MERAKIEEATKAGKKARQQTLNGTKLGVEWATRELESVFCSATFQLTAITTPAGLHLAIDCLVWRDTASHTA